MGADNEKAQLRVRVIDLALRPLTCREGAIVGAHSQLSVHIATVNCKYSIHTAHRGGGGLST